MNYPLVLDIHFIIPVNSSDFLFLFRRISIMYLPKEEGQGLVEYALILALISIVVIGVLTLLGKNVNNKLSTVASTLN